MGHPRTANNVNVPVEADGDLVLDLLVGGCEGLGLGGDPAWHHLAGQVEPYRRKLSNPALHIQHSKHKTIGECIIFIGI